MRRNILLILLTAAILLTALWYYFPREPETSPVDREITIQREKLAAAPAPLPTVPEETQPPYESPIDFPALQAVNADIIAWLDIPGTDISYPVLRHSTNNAFYLNHAENGGSSEAGAIFVEDYNSRELTDPALAIYGHHLRNGAYFGNLQNFFETAEGFAQHREIILYTPDRETHFQVFAAVPYNKTHLLYTYHFGNRYEYDQFLEHVLTVRDFHAQLDIEAAPEYGTQLVILSTCLKANNQQRFLVIGAAKEDTP